MRTVVVYSGGLDSTVLLAWCCAQGGDVAALSVHYGQRHVRELQAAEACCRAFAVPWQCADLRGLQPLLRGSSQTDPAVPVPHGHYTAETMQATVVPNRNMLLLATALAYAVSTRAARVAYAAHSGDHAIYPDCRPAFVAAMQQAAALCDAHAVEVAAPFLTWSKAAIVREGAQLGVPFAQTWSCYEGGAVHCGRCGTCVERREAFCLAGVLDPTEYAYVDPDETLSL